MCADRFEGYGQVWYVAFTRDGTLVEPLAETPTGIIAQRLSWAGMARAPSRGGPCSRSSCSCRVPCP
jgi:hypothetical protein